METSLQLNLDAAFLRRVRTVRVKTLAGFRSSHTEPKFINGTTRNFVRQVAGPGVAAELTEVYNRLKSELRLRRREITLDLAGAISTRLFRYTIEVEQSPEESARAIETRLLVLKGPPAELPGNFDAVFPESPQEIVIPFVGLADFDHLVEAFEDLEEAFGGSLVESQETQVITYTSAEGTTLRVDGHNNEVTFRPRTAATIRDLIEQSQAALGRFADVQKKLRSS